MSLGNKKKPKQPSTKSAKGSCGGSYGGENKPIDKKINRLRELAAIGRNKRTSEQNQELCKLLGNTGPSTVFEKRDKKNRERLTKELQKLVKNDKLVAKASEDWSTMSDPDKKKVMKKVLAAQRRAYKPKMAAPKIETYNEGVKDGFITNGTYNHGTNTIRVNMNSQAKAGTSFEKTVMLLCHEQAHKYQHLIVDRMKSGKIGPSSLYYRQAQIWEANTRAYQSTSKGDSFDCYHDQSLERHSHTVEDAVAAAI
ncbi:MAG: hypothetical protein SGI77_04640 [Pirellulaceae bacterium]|nr:hypothetical protein [Pirellulaceae bacterium]